MKVIKKTIINRNSHLESLDKISVKVLEKLRISEVGSTIKLFNAKLQNKACSDNSKTKNHIIKFYVKN